MQFTAMVSNRLISKLQNTVGRMLAHANVSFKNVQFKYRTANLLTKLVNRTRRPIFDTRCPLQVKHGEIIADVNLVGVTDHPEAALRVKIAVTRTESEHICLNAHQVSYTPDPNTKSNKTMNRH